MKLHNSKLGEKFHFLTLTHLNKINEVFSLRYKRLDMSKKLRGEEALGLAKPPEKILFNGNSGSSTSTGYTSFTNQLLHGLTFGIFGIVCQSTAG